MTILKSQIVDRLWYDCLNVTVDQLVELAQKLNIKQEVLLQALDSELLPQLRHKDQCLAMILRLVEPSKKSSVDSLHELTTKLSIFITDQFVVTVHRMDLKFIKDIQSQNDLAKLTTKQLVQVLFEESLVSFDEPLNHLDAQGEKFEESIFSTRKTNILFKQGLLLKRRSSAYKKNLKFTYEIVNKLSTHSEFKDLNYDEIREMIQRYLFYTDEILENVTSLLSLHVSMMSHKTNEASYRTNEIVRVLTVFSIFFLPLNFITGLYGMNFENIPELKFESAYFIVLGLMVFISYNLYLWMKRQGWLKTSDKNI